MFPPSHLLWYRRIKVAECESTWAKPPQTSLPVWEQIEQGSQKDIRTQAPGVSRSNGEATWLWERSDECWESGIVLFCGIVDQIRKLWRGSELWFPCAIVPSWWYCPVSHMLEDQGHLGHGVIKTVSSSEGHLKNRAVLGFPLWSSCWESIHKRAQHENGES